MKDGSRFSDGSEMMRVVPCIYALLVVLAARAAESGPFRLDLFPYAGQVELNYLGLRLATYQFRSEARQPGLRELNTLLGVPLLIDSPENPPRQRAVSVGLSLQGVNFGENGEDAGWQQSGPEVSRSISRDSAGRLVAEIAHTVLYGPTQSTVHAAEEAWLLEQRQVRFLIDETVAEVAVDWLSEFEVRSGAGAVTVQVSEDQGLVLRCSPQLEGVVVTSVVSSPGTEASRTVDTVHTNGISLTGTVAGRPVTVAVLGEGRQAGGLHGATRFDPATLVAVHPTVDSAGRTLQPGEGFRWHYLVVVRPIAMLSASLQARRTEWLRSEP